MIIPRKMPPFIPSTPSSPTIWRPVTDNDFSLLVAQQHYILASPSVAEIVAEFRKKQNVLAQIRVQCLGYNYSVWQRNQGELKILRVYAVL